MGNHDIRTNHTSSYFIFTVSIKKTPWIGLQGGHLPDTEPESDTGVSHEAKHQSVRSNDDFFGFSSDSEMAITPLSPISGLS